MHLNYVDIEKVFPYPKKKRRWGEIHVHDEREEENSSVIFLYQLVHEKFIKWYCWDSLEMMAKMEETTRNWKKCLSYFTSTRERNGSIGPKGEFLFIIYSHDRWERWEQSDRWKTRSARGWKKCCFKIDVAWIENGKSEGKLIKYFWAQFWNFLIRNFIASLHAHPNKP